MYLVGASPLHQAQAHALVISSNARLERLITSAEIFQEILHRYVSIRRMDAIDPAFRALQGIVDEVVSVEHRDVMRAREIVQLPSALSARDALHVAVMERHHVSRLMSFDGDFDRWQGIERVYRV
jgi:uncharacterized protein